MSALHPMYASEGAVHAALKAGGFKVTSWFGHRGANFIARDGEGRRVMVDARTAIGERPLASDTLAGCLWHVEALS